MSFPLCRRSVLTLLSGATLMPLAMAAPSASIRIADSRIALEFDPALKSRVQFRSANAWITLTDFDTSESLHLAGGKTAGPFRFAGHRTTRVRDSHGKGERHEITGKSDDGLEKTVTLTLYERYPGFVVQRVIYRNGGTKALNVEGWGNGAHMLKETGRGFWSWNGSSHDDRRDWVLPVTPGFNQANFMGMNGADYGGGTPIVDVWRPDAGIAVGHLALTPKLVSLPLVGTVQGAAVAVDMDDKQTLAPGAEFTTFETFLTVHQGDFFATLETYQKLMTDRGLGAPKRPAGSYESIWCAWGYGREVSVDEVRGAMPKAAELGLKWAVLDDGWQKAIGDWVPIAKKYPAGDADMKALVKTIKDAGMRPRLWIAPLAAAPGSDLLHDRSDMLLRGPYGEPQMVSFWNSLTLCPAYAPTVQWIKQVMTRIIGEWGFDGVKIDGQHLNGVAPCHNPDHHHAHPTDSVEGLQLFWKAVYDTVRAINPNAVVEICPCGDSYAYYNFPYMDQAPGSDPTSSFQVRLKGKSLKALMGPAAPFAGDHVELSDNGDDFASTVGIGAIVSTKFTYPGEGHGESTNVRLTPEKEAVWRKWIKIYGDKMLPLGRYRGELYDMGFDKPEAHAIEKDGRLYYAFYAKEWNGPIELRGLKGPCTVHDYVDGRDLGTVSPAQPRITVSFRRALLIEAVPTGSSA